MIFTLNASFPHNFLRAIKLSIDRAYVGLTLVILHRYTRKLVNDMLSRLKKVILFQYIKIGNVFSETESFRVQSYSKHFF